MHFVDSHCHLNFDVFEKDRIEVLTRAHAVGVQAIVLISTNLNHAPELQSFIQNLAEIQNTQQKSFPKLYYSIGMHPTDCTQESENDIEKYLIENSIYPEMVGFGETGLDYYHENFNKKIQQTVFQAHLKAACGTNHPVIVHSRSAETDTVDILKNFPQVQGVIHCFTGSKEMARACLDLGFYISFSGIVTFKNATALQDIANFVPVDRLLIETDAPYLAPVPHRGERNEPSFLKHTLDYIAYLKELTPEVLAYQTTRNFFNLFNKAAL